VEGCGCDLISEAAPSWPGGTGSYNKLQKIQLPSFPRLESGPTKKQCRNITASADFFIQFSYLHTYTQTHTHTHT